ncbi:hypothetical protein PIB30_074227 [Stylosanthes scabra]|uniref:Uncharacterized protein n=1 Tax=Stylosanthes scabra TaxID=79078 RepID=A0ABU6RPR1_9FABA|nr:hypothetical protein [Stylosanthes scabra]
MDHEGNLEHLLQDPPEDAGTLGWIELTETVEEVAEVEGGLICYPPKQQHQRRCDRMKLPSSIATWAHRKT